MNEEPLKTPVLLLGFNRLDEITRVLEVISQVRPERLYVACDGPRNEQEAELVGRVRAVVQDMITWDCQLKTLYRESNLGCGRAVSEAITWFFECEEAGIILEDDCLPDPSFFAYCDLMLRRYKNDDRVHHVGGCNPLSQGGRSSEYYFSQFNRIWGWASWRDSWAHYDISIQKWPQLKADGFLNEFFSKRVVAQYTRIFDSLHAGGIDTWDYQWFLCRLQLGLAVIPQVNLVRNIGFGGTGTNTHNSYDPMASMETGEFVPSDFEPTLMEADVEKDLQWEKMLIKSAAKMTKLRNLVVGLIGRIRG